MPRHAKPAPPRRRSPHLALAGAAVAAIVLFGGSATAAAIVPAGIEEETTLLECKTIEKPGSSTSSSTHVQDKPPAAPSKPSPAPGKPPLDAAPSTTAPAEPPTEPSTPPAQGGGTTAAEVHGWGTPIAEASDEFNYVGAPDAAKWAVYDSAGHDGNGRRTPERVTVDGDKLVMTGLPNGDSAGMASLFNQQYGRWEARVRTSQEDNGGTPYRPLQLIWPESEAWPSGGEYDWFENPAPGIDSVTAYLHYPHPGMPVQQEKAVLEGIDTSEFFTVAFEWTPDYIAGFVNGEEFYRFADGAGPGGRENIQDMASGHLAIQLDADTGSGLNPATYETDWVRTYALN